MISTNTIRQSIIIKADRERVWKAITTPRHFSKWFEMEITFPKLAPGEPMYFDPNGLNGKARIVTVEPPERFAFYWTAEPGVAVETLVTFQLESVPEGTRLTVTDVGYDALPDSVMPKRFQMNDEGWGIQVKNVARYIEGGRDRDA